MKVQVDRVRLPSVYGLGCFATTVLRGGGRGRLPRLSPKPYWRRCGRLSRLAPSLSPRCQNARRPAISLHPRRARRLFRRRPQVFGDTTGDRSEGVFFRQGAGGIVQQPCIKLSFRARVRSQTVFARIADRSFKQDRPIIIDLGGLDCRGGRETSPECVGRSPHLLDLFLEPPRPSNPTKSMVDFGVRAFAF